MIPNLVLISFRKKRIIDLSYAAAKELDMVRQGVAKVEIYEQKDSLLVVNQIDSLKTVRLPE